MSTLDSSFRDRTRRNFGRKRTTIAIVIIIFAASVPFLTPVLRPIGNIVAIPIYATSNFIGELFSPITDYFSSKKILADENRQLKENISNLLASSIERDSLARERDELLETLRFKKEEPKSITVSILSRPPATTFDTLLINKGNESGIEEGNFAYWGKVPIGIVSRVESNNSVVTLLSAGGAELSVSIGGKSVSVIGRGNGDFSVTLPSKLSPATGTAITTIDGDPIATVSAVVAGSGEGTSVALLSSIVDLNTIRYLNIVDKN